MTRRTYSIDTSGGPLVRLKTQRIGLITFDVEAPATGGHLHVAPDGSAFRIELALNQLSTGNPVLEKAARALVAHGNGEALVFDASGPGGDEPWTFSGDAQAGDVIVPMEVTARMDHDSSLSVDGEATFHDVHIPLPGFSHLKEISFAVTARLPVMPAR